MHNRGATGARYAGLLPWQVRGRVDRAVLPAAFDGCQRASRKVLLDLWGAGGAAVWFLGLRWRACQSATVRLTSVSMAAMQDFNMILRLIPRRIGLCVTHAAADTALDAAPRRNLSISAPFWMLSRCQQPFGMFLPRSVAETFG